MNTTPYTLREQLTALDEQLVALEQTYRAQSLRGTLDREAAGYRYKVLRSVRDTLRYVHLNPTPGDLSAAREWVEKAETDRQVRHDLLLIAIENTSLHRRVKELESQLQQGQTND